MSEELKTCYTCETSLVKETEAGPVSVYTPVHIGYFEYALCSTCAKVFTKMMDTITAASAKMNDVTCNCSEQLITIEVPKIERIHTVLQYGLPIICIYESPADYPGKYVARVYAVTEGQTRPGIYIALADTLEEIRAKLPEGMYPVRRHKSDDPCIVETWI